MAITVKPNEKGTAIVTFTFTDEDESVVVPTANAWQLMDVSGNVINSRSFAACGFTGTEIVLSGDDLAMFGVLDTGVRIIAYQGTYDSDAGSDLPLNDEELFRINALVSQVDL